MVNHVRCLLLNASVASAEYVPPGFAPVELPGPLRTVRAVLFGAQPSRDDLDGRLDQLMRCLHATELEGHVLAFDPRVTYLPFPAVSAVRPPAPDLAAVLAGLASADPGALFGAAASEPQATWRALWASGMPPPYRLGAACLALAYRTDLIRTGS